MRSPLKAKISFSNVQQPNPKHGQKTKGKTKNATKTPKMKITEMTEYNCELCNKQFSSYKVWHGHKKEVHGNKQILCEICNKYFKCRRYYVRHKTEIHGENKIGKKKGHYKCKECNAVFTSIDSLGQHKNNVHQNENVACEICDSTFKSKNYLRSHIARVHYDDGKQHKCKICQKTFKSPRYLRVHMKNSHKGSTKFRCCAKNFGNEIDLEEHSKKKHKKERFVCQLCFKSLKNQNNLVMHMQKKHVNKEDKIMQEEDKKKEDKKRTVIKMEEPHEFEITIEDVSVGLKVETSF